MKLPPIPWRLRWFPVVFVLGLLVSGACGAGAFLLRPPATPLRELGERIIWAMDASCIVFGLVLIVLNILNAREAMAYWLRTNREIVEFQFKVKWIEQHMSALDAMLATEDAKREDTKH